MTRRRRRPPLKALALVAAAAAAGCGSSLDRGKFEDALRASTAVREDIETHGGTGRSVEQLLGALDSELVVLETRVSSPAEQAVLTELKGAAESLAAFVRFRFLDLESVDGHLLAMGTNRELVARYNLWVSKSVEGGDWVESELALRTTLEDADRHLAAVRASLSTTN